MGCKLPAVSSFHSNSQLGPVKEEMGWLSPDPLPGRPGRSLKESGPGLYFSPPNAKLTAASGTSPQLLSQPQ